LSKKVSKYLTWFVILVLGVGIGYGMNNGTPVLPSTRNLVFGTDFQNVQKTTELGIPVLTLDAPNSMNYRDGASIVEVTERNGESCLHLQVFDALTFNRAEFALWKEGNIPYENGLTTDDLYVKSTLELPSDFHLMANDPSYQRWFCVFDVIGDYGYPPVEPAGTERQFILTAGVMERVYSEQNWFVQAQLQSPFEQLWREETTVNAPSIPLGEPFEVEYYVHRDQSNGKFKLWINGELVFDVAGVNTKPNDAEYFIIPAKVYYNPTDSSQHELWIYSVEVWDGVKD